MKDEFTVNKFDFDQTDSTALWHAINIAVEALRPFARVGSLFNEESLLNMCVYEAAGDFTYRLSGVHLRRAFDAFQALEEVLNGGD